MKRLAAINELQQAALASGAGTPPARLAFAAGRVLAVGSAGMRQGCTRRNG